MTSFNYMNNTAPFWDFLAGLEQQGNNHPFFGRNRQGCSNENKYGEDHEGQQPPLDPWRLGHQFFGGPGGLPHRGPPPPSNAHVPSHHDEQSPHYERKGEKEDEKSENENDNGEGPSGSDSGPDSEGGRRCRRGRHGHCGSRRGRHGFGGRGGFGPYQGGPGHHGPHGHHGPSRNGPGRVPSGFPAGPFQPFEGPFGETHGHDSRGHRGSHHHGGPGRRGPWGCNGPFGGGAGSDPSSIFNPFFDAFMAEQPSNKNNDATAAKENEDFTPEADIFDTSSSYIIHISLPGAKKEDVGVNWDAEKSELSVAGVIYRPGDEELLKTLAMNERKVGPFERKIRLGTRANPAHVDADGITAKLEDGVLRVEVRKEDEGFVEIKKVDIE